MKGVKSQRHVQRFLSTHDQIANVFSRPPPTNAPSQRRHHPLCPHPGVYALGRGDRRGNGRMITPNSGIASFHAPNRNKLTVPEAAMAAAGKLSGTIAAAGTDGYNPHIWRKASTTANPILLRLVDRGG